MGVLLRTPLAVLVLAGALAGVGVAAVVSALETPRSRAEGSLVVERGTEPLTGAQGLVRTIRDLGESDTVAQTVVRNLSLHESSGEFAKRVAVTEDGGSAVLRVRADATDATRAKAIVLQLGLVLTELVRQRFGQATPNGAPVQLAVLDQPHTLPGRVSPDWRRNLGWGALFGLVGGLLGANLVAARRPPRLVVEAPPVLGTLGSDGAFDRIAGRLLELARERPFQTIVVVGDRDASVATGVAAALAGRGVTATSTSAGGAAGAAARHAFVLVAAADLEPELLRDADAVVAVTDGSPPPLELVVGLRGVRLLGVVEGA